MDENKQTNFFLDVHEVTKLIPVGRVTSYGAIAHYLGSKRGARMVGWALSQVISIENQKIPAHRVVNRLGVLSGRLNFQTPTYMQELLEAEGVVIVDNKVRDFQELFWDPSVVLG